MTDASSTIEAPLASKGISAAGNIAMDERLKSQEVEGADEILLVSSVNIIY